MHCKQKRLEKLLLAKIRLLKQALEDLDYIIIKVSGESMIPTFFDNDKVIIYPVIDVKDISNGDILLFYDFEYILVLHRLVSKENNRFILKGDNATNLDDISLDNIVGRVSTDTICDINKKSIVYSEKIDGYVMNLIIANNELSSFELDLEGDG